MKRLIFIAITCSCLTIWQLSGCDKPAAETDNQKTSSLRQQEQSKLPPEVAGAWQMRDGIWRIVIEPNGVVSSAIIPIMQAEIKPHQTTYVEMKDGNVSSFTGGDMVAEFNPENRELSVYIELKNFLIKFFEVRTGGNTVDTFNGPVSEDGKVWKPGWVNVFDYGPEFPIDVNAIEPTLCIFDKVEQN